MTAMDNYNQANTVLKAYIDGKAGIIIENYYEYSGNSFLIGTGIKSGETSNYSVYYTTNTSTTPSIVTSSISVDNNGIWYASWNTSSYTDLIDTLFVANANNTKVSGPWIPSNYSNDKPSILTVVNSSGFNNVYCFLPNGSTGYNLYGMSDSSSSVTNLGNSWSSSSNLYYISYNPSSYPTDNLFVAKNDTFGSYSDLSNVYVLSKSGGQTPIIGNLYISSGYVYATGIGIPNGDSSYYLFGYTSGNSSPSSITSISSPSSGYWSISYSLSSYTYESFFVAKSDYSNPSNIWTMSDSETTSSGAIGAVTPSSSSGYFDVYGIAPSDGGSYYLYYWYKSSGSISYYYNSVNNGEFNTNISVSGDLLGVVLTKYEYIGGSSRYTPISSTYVPSSSGSVGSPGLVAVVPGSSSDSYNIYYVNIPSSGSYYIYYYYKDTSNYVQSSSTSASSGSSNYATIYLNSGNVLLSTYVASYDGSNYIPVSNIYTYGG